MGVDKGRLMTANCWLLASGCSWVINGPAAVAIMASKSHHSTQDVSPVNTVKTEMLSVYCIVYSEHCRVVSVQCALYSLQCSVCTVWWSVFNLQCAMYSLLYAA